MFSTVNVVPAKLNCPLCGEQSVKALLSKPKNFQVYICTSCKLGQTIPYPEESNGQEYFSNSDEYFANHYATNQEIWHKFMAFLLDRARPYVTSGAMLDIGTGIGFMLELAQERGFKAMGIEPSPAATRYAREKLHLEVFQAHFPAPELEGKQFNLITMSHVLEHVPDPINFLIEVKAHLKPNGIVVITAPSYYSLLTRMLGWRWTGFQPTQHIWQLTPTTAAMLCRRAGLTILEEYSSSLGYVGNSPKICIKRFFGAFGAFINLGDQLVIVAKNPSGLS